MKRAILKFLSTSFLLCKYIKKFFDKITSKGWNIYNDLFGQADYSGEEIVRKGPVNEINSNTKYLIYPAVEDPCDKKSIDVFIEEHQLVPSITTPNFLFPGHVIHDFPRSSPEVEYLFPGRKLDPFFGFVILPEENLVRLNLRSRTFLDQYVFEVALDSLNDISNLLDPKGANE